MKYDYEAHMIEKQFASHGVKIKLASCEEVGDGTVRIYTVKFVPGAKEKQFFDCASDVQLIMQLPLFQPYREGLKLCLAVSRRTAMKCSLPEMLTNSVLEQLDDMWLPIALGLDMRRKPHFMDLAKAPHALSGGGTNSGKTEGLRSTVTSLIATQPVNRLNLILIDTGTSASTRGLDLFHALPHLSHPIVKDVETALFVLLSLGHEMERRKTLSEDELRLSPAIICIIDEYLSLISGADNAEERAELTSVISSLLQRGRHAKIHLILATQEAAKQDMLINLNNIPARMAFACSNYYNSVSILGASGAEKLPGKGAMLFRSPENPVPLYLQGAYISTEEIEELLTRINTAHHDLSNKFVIPEITQPQPQTAPETRVLENISPKPDHAAQELTRTIVWALGRDTVSVTQAQKEFHMGRPRATEILDQLHGMGLITKKFANQPRSVLPQSVEEISAEIMGFLERNGVSADNVVEAIASRS